MHFLPTALTLINRLKQNVERTPSIHRCLEPAEDIERTLLYIVKHTEIGKDSSTTIAARCLHCCILVMIRLLIFTIVLTVVSFIFCSLGLFLFFVNFFSSNFGLYNLPPNTLRLLYLYTVIYIVVYWIEYNKCSNIIII